MSKMNKANWIIGLLLTAGLTISPFSTAQATFTDSLHYRLSSDTAVWNEELDAYIVEIGFEMKWDVPNEPVTKIGMTIFFNTSQFQFHTAIVDSSNWSSHFNVVWADNFSNPGVLSIEWELAIPFVDSNWTTGAFVHYGDMTFIIADQSSGIEGVMTFKLGLGNVAKIINPWDVFESNFVEGTQVFLGITETPCCNSPGDANNNGTFNISDVTFVISRIFAGGAPAPCLAEADADANATLNIADVTFMIARIFAGGPAPSCVSTIP